MNVSGIDTQDPAEIGEFEGVFRARFKSVRALRFLLHTLRLRYFCSGKIHKFCCKIASMQVELTLFVTPSLKVSWLPSEVYVLSGDLSKRALRESSMADQANTTPGA